MKTNHRNTAVLTPTEFVTKAKKLLGDQNKVWRKRFCNLTGYSPSTVTRMISGDIPVTMIVDSFFFALELMAFDDKIDYIKEFGLDD